MKSMATSAMAAERLSLFGKEVVRDERISNAADWIAKPVSRRPLRPNL